MDQPVYQAIGRRKESRAKVRLMPGTGIITVNKKPLADYVQREILEVRARAPFEVTETIGKYDVVARVSGGGISAQAGAISLGIARALVLVGGDQLKVPLRKHGLLTRDQRMKERKKYGQRGARARFQFSKR